MQPQPPDQPPVADLPTRERRPDPMSSPRGFADVLTRHEDGYHGWVQVLGALRAVEVAVEDVTGVLWREDADRVRLVVLPELRELRELVCDAVERSVNERTMPKPARDTLTGGREL